MFFYVSLDAVLVVAAAAAVIGHAEWRFRTLRTLGRLLMADVFALTEELRQRGQVGPGGPEEGKG